MALVILGILVLVVIVAVTILGNTVTDEDMEGY